MDHEKLLARARKQFENDQADEKPLRDEAEVDLKFEAGDQWDEAIKAQRINAKRPAMTFPRCHTFVQKVSNEGRQNKPQIKFIPAEEDDKQTAEVYEGMARHIQYDSPAQEAYENALECSAAGGFGYFRFITEYCDDESFDQDLKIIPVHDPFSVYGILIPTCFGIEPDHAFVVTEIPTDQYKIDYPKSKVASDFQEACTDSGGWISTETVRIAEYWYVESENVTLERGGKSRPIVKKTVKSCKINGAEVIPGSETTWPGYCIPIVPVLGKKRIISGKANLYSVIRFQRDPQRLINFYKTRIAETLGTAPIQPYMVVRGQIPPQLKNQWETLNTNMRPYLEYESVDIDGKPAPPPQRQVFEAPIVALSGAAMQEIDDMKATTGIFDASLGQKSNETSGRALLARQQESDITNLHFMDNLERAFKKGGRILADAMPKVYDTPRIVRILGPDEAPELVKINQATVGKDKKPTRYKIGGEGVAKMDVVVTIGRAFNTKRLESFDTVSQVVASNPDMLPMVGDILFKNSDVAGADQLAERFEKMLPPNLQKQEGQPEIPPQVQAQMQEQGQMIDGLTKELNAKNQLIESKQAELDSKERQVALQEEVKLAIAEITTKAQNELKRAQLEYDLAIKLDANAHERGMQAAQQAHEAMTQAGQQGHEEDMQSSQFDHAAQSQQTDIQAQQQAAEQAAQQGAGA